MGDLVLSPLRIIYSNHGHAVSVVPVTVIWLSRDRMLDARRNVICTPAHIGKSLVHTLLGGQALPEAQVRAAGNSDKPDISNEASAAANERSPGSMKTERSVSGAGRLAHQKSRCAGSWVRNRGVRSRKAATSRSFTKLVYVTGQLAPRIDVGTSAAMASVLNEGVCWRASI